MSKISISDKLFDYAEPAALNGCVTDYESLESYAYCYKASADLLLNVLILFNDNDSLKHFMETELFKFADIPVAPNNDYVIPVAYLFRHSIELELKNIYSILISKECIKNKNEPNKDNLKRKITKHSLLELWDIIVPLLQNNLKRIHLHNKDFRIIRNYLNELDLLDKKSTSFRYPYDVSQRDGSKTNNLKSVYHINLLQLKINIHKLFKLIDKIKYSLEFDFEFYNDILTTTDSRYYKDINTKRYYISEHQYKHTIHKIDLLWERKIEPYAKHYQDYLDPKIVNKIKKLKSLTKKYCNIRLKNKKSPTTKEKIYKLRLSIRRICKKYIGTSKNYY